jgi:hypothetical protein
MAGRATLEQKSGGAQSQSYGSQHEMLVYRLWNGRASGPGSLQKRVDVNKHWGSDQTNCGAPEISLPARSEASR